ncbi:hypothetical protein [uncultured Duncaniella sp.]|uniref:hypothetical protein n=2 Tax=uncultured Duncaniella sp. TaxID=2768039 RepID=UPI002605146E|nr:hypothetical protein [uncultured Duncaniella sp.]
MKKTTKLAALLLCCVMVLGLMTGCIEHTAETEYTNDLKDQIQDMYGFPEVTNFFEYSQLKEIYEMRDNPNLICYWYTKNEYSGKWVYQGVCVGYGIPYGAAITAPESAQNVYANGSYHSILPLAEPNGLYTESVVTTATWILTTDSSGDIKPTYVESEIMVSQSKVDARLCEDWSIPTDY